MDEPRIHVRGKAEQKKQLDRPSSSLHWTSRGSRPPQYHKSDDYWTPYLKKRAQGPKRSSGSASGQPLLKWIASGGSAVLVGTLMGWIILNVFVGEQTHSIDTHLEESVPSVDHHPNHEVTDGAVALPELTTVWVQGGVYSGPEGANELAEAQRKQGKAAIVRPINDQYHVFLGIGFTHDEALAIASQMKEKGADVYLKDDLSVVGTSLEGLTAEQGKQLQELVEAGQHIVQRLSALSTAGIANGDVAAELRREVDQVEQTHRTFLTASREMQGALSGEQKQALDTMEQALTRAVEAAKQYRQEISSSLLWQIQDGLMQYAIAYEQLGRMHKP